MISLEKNILRKHHIIIIVYFSFISAPILSSVILPLLEKCVCEM